MKQIVLEIKNLSCPNCAKKIEENIAKLDFVENVTLSFPTKKVYIEVNKSSEQILSTIIKTIKDTEDVEVVVCEGDIKPKEKRAPLFILKRDWPLLMGAILFITTYFLEEGSPIYITLILISYLFLGWRVLITSIKNISHGEIFDENFLMAVATIGALIIKQYPEAVAVMLFYEIGELFQEYAVDSTRRSIESVMDLRVEEVRIKNGETIINKKPAEAQVGEIMVVKPGERIALDGIIVSGQTQVDTSSITGEFVPRTINQGEEILSGYINKTNVIEVQITTPESESTVSRILNLVSNANSKKTHIERFITKFAKYYTPIVVGLALFIGIVPSLIDPANASSWIYKALTFLVVSCPCAIVISVPLGLFAGLGSASSNGILIKGSNYLEALNSVDTIVFDKTGTLTKGEFRVTEIKAIDRSNDELLKIAAYGESGSNHPIAKSIVKAFNQELDTSLVTNYQEIAGYGIEMEFHNHHYSLGNDKFLTKYDLEVPNLDVNGSVVFIIEDQRYIGYIVIGDTLKDNSKLAIKTLKKLGVKKTVMLTGDREASALKIKEALDIDEVHAQLLPDQKVEEVEKIINYDNHNLVAFVGDGMNDAPVLARADVGISMGGLGSDAAVEASDIVLMEDDPLSIAKAIIIAKKTKAILNQNIIFAIGVKILIMILVLTNHANMWAGVFGDVGVTVLAIINSMRALKVRCDIKE